jgi:hypothetical protein
MQTQAELIRGAGAARDRPRPDGPSTQCGDGGDHGVPAAVGQPSGSAGEGAGDNARGVRRDRGRGQEAEGACGSGPAQRPRSAALSLGGRVPCAAAASGQKERAAGKTRRPRERVICHFSAGECTERGRSVKALRFAPTATRRKECGLD